ncbi:unnamed protein product [Gordionus sp. m RMFG-2023]
MIGIVKMATKIKSNYSVAKIQRINEIDSKKLIYESFKRSKENFLKYGQLDTLRNVYFKLQMVDFDFAHLLELFPNNGILSPYTKIISKSHRFSNMTFTDQRGQHYYSRYVHNKHFLGKILGIDDSYVTMSLIKDQINACMWYMGKVFTVKSLPRRFRRDINFDTEEHSTVNYVVVQEEKDVNRQKYQDKIPRKLDNLKTRRSKRKTKNEYAASKGDNYRKIEMAIFMDHVAISNQLIDGNYDLALNYILTTFNQISLLYVHPSLGILIELEIVKIVFVGESERNLKIDNFTDVYLERFCKYQAQFSERDWDEALLLTGLDIVDKDGKSGVVGVGYVDAMCNALESCALIEVLRHGYHIHKYVAHEIGHNLGLNHDEVLSGDKGNCTDRNYIMRAITQYTYDFWSICSRKSLVPRIDSYSCLMRDDSSMPYKYTSFKMNNMRNKDLWNIKKTLPGQFLTLDEQCSYSFGSRNYAAKMINCQDMQCVVDMGRENHVLYTILTHLGPPLEGTWCAKDKWCIDGKCQSWNNKLWVLANSNISAPNSKVIDGKYGNWKSIPDLRLPSEKDIRDSKQFKISEISAKPQLKCFNPCISGSIYTQIWISTCSKPYPQNNGSRCKEGAIRIHFTQCVPDSKETCNSFVSAESYDLEFCKSLHSKHPDWKINPGSRKNHVDKCFYQCIANSNSSEIIGDQLIKYFPDGTACDNRTNADAQKINITVRKFCLDRKCGTLPPRPSDFIISYPTTTVGKAVMTDAKVVTIKSVSAPKITATIFSRVNTPTPTTSNISHNYTISKEHNTRNDLNTYEYEDDDNTSLSTPIAIYNNFSTFANATQEKKKRRRTKSSTTPIFNATTTHIEKKSKKKSKSTKKTHKGTSDEYYDEDIKSGKSSFSKLGSPQNIMWMILVGPFIVLLLIIVGTYFMCRTKSSVSENGKTTSGVVDPLYNDAIDKENPERWDYYANYVEGQHLAYPGYQDVMKTDPNYDYAPSNYDYSQVNENDYSNYYETQPNLQAISRPYTPPYPSYKSY